AMSALDYRFVLGPGQIITIQQVRGGTPAITVPGETVSRARVLQAITAGAGPEVEAVLSEVFTALRRESDDVSSSVVFMHRLLADALHAIEALGVDYREVSSLGRNPFERLSEMKTLGEMER
ncbi:MAG: hypothetical protein ACOCYQ_06250, partial [Alkalispirochaeta sp.]